MQRSAVNETRAGGGTVRIEWTYDALNRLTNENYNSSDNTKDYAASFTFDLSGNRLSKLQTGNFEPGATTYVVNDRDQLVLETGSGDVVMPYTYDPNGSTLSKGLDTFGWDLRNRMKSASVGGVVTAYTYDTSGIRVREKTGADDVYYLTTNVNPTGYAQTVEQWKVGNPSADASYNWGRDLASQTRAGVTSYYVKDGLGSTRALTNATGNVTDTFDYAAYGEVVTRTGTTPNVYEFAGQHVDQRIGQSYNRARWHNLDGRWTSDDPAEFGPGELADANQYLYVGATPINGTDPTGMFTGLVDMLTSIGNISAQQGARLAPAGNAYRSARTVHAAMKFIARAEKAWDTVTSALEVIDLMSLDVSDLVELKDAAALLPARGWFNIEIPNGIRNKLDRLAGSFDNIPAVQGMIGVVMAALVTKVMGWESTSIGAAYHGIDAIMKDTIFNRFAVVEAKGGPHARLRGEMSESWIRSRLRKISDENSSGADAAAFATAVDSRGRIPMSALVVKTDIRSKPGYIAAKLQTYPNIGPWGAPF